MKDHVLLKLEKVVSKEPSKWHEESQFRIDNKEWLKRSQLIALKVLLTLRAKGWSQAKLADEMCVSVQSVSQWVKGKEYFTPETIHKLEEVLEIKLNTSKTRSELYKNFHKILVKKQNRNKTKNTNVKL